MIRLVHVEALISARIWISKVGVKDDWDGGW